MKKPSRRFKGVPRKVPMGGSTGPRIQEVFELDPTTLQPKANIVPQTFTSQGLNLDQAIAKMTVVQEQLNQALQPIRIVPKKYKERLVPDLMQADLDRILNETADDDSFRT